MTITVTGILTPEQRRAGYLLTEEEDFVHLWRVRGDFATPVATFSAAGATVTEIRAAADAHPPEETPLDVLKRHEEARARRGGDE
ncbi:MAG: hypothetical protein ACOC58_00160 [Chloroflexota bacterium]